MKKKILVLSISVAVLLMFCVCAEAFKLPDTGQTKCYDSIGAEIPDCAVTGQDGEYSINPMSYTVNYNADCTPGNYLNCTVTDNNTGLMWEGSSSSSGYNWYDASGTYDSYSNPDSSSVCGDMSKGGYDDWRLPTRKELLSIVDYSIPDPGPTIDENYFGNAWSAEYWTSTNAPNTVFASAWGVDFALGNLVSDYKYAGGWRVRCVRGEMASQSFTNNNDGTITDNYTGLIWQQGETDVMTWSEALSYCNNLVLPIINGQTDWRLPNIREIVSIIDETRLNPAINLTYFPNAKTNYYWSSTNYATDPGDAWSVNFVHGGIGSVSKGGSYYVRCVRGGQASGPFAITTKANGTGAGSLTSSPTGISYNYPAKNTGSSEFDANVTVKFTAKGVGSNVSWGSTCAAAGGTVAGNGTGTATCIIKVTKAATVTAAFTQIYSKITANSKGTGAGSVVSTPVGISYTFPAVKTDFGTYKNASTVKVTAKAKTGSKTSWGGTCKTAGGTETGNNTLTAVCTIKVAKTAVIAATFAQFYTITAKATGNGVGSVVSVPAGINYKYPAKKTDSGSYAKGSTLKVSAKANSGYKATWNNTCKTAGGTETGNNTRTAVCTIKVTKAAAVTATFKK